jgi:hypothetical protein
MSITFDIVSYLNAWSFRYSNEGGVARDGCGL